MYKHTYIHSTKVKGARQERAMTHGHNERCEQKNGIHTGNRKRLAQKYVYTPSDLE